MSIAEGFPGQRLTVLPRPVVARALGQAGTRALLVTDCGYFPRARAHGRRRDEPIEQAIVLLCTAGAGWCMIDGTRHEVRAGQLAVIPPGLPHAYGSDPEEPWTLWWMHLDGADIPELLGPQGALWSTPVRTLSGSFPAAALMQEIVQALERDISPAQLFAASSAAAHFLALAATDPGGGRGGPVERARSYLQAHVAGRISVAQLAAMVSLSPSHFAAMFRDQVGLPVLAYQTQLRMLRARELLDTTELPVAAIAARLGYADPFYFSRQFRREHGTTPLNYRAQGKG